jgi:hypothetical protein
MAMHARLPDVRLPALVPVVAVLVGTVIALVFWLVTAREAGPLPDPRGIPRCPPGAEADLLSAAALRCWLDAPGGHWRTLSRAWAFRALVVKAEASDVGDAEEIARRWVADCGDEFSEILIYVQREPAPRPTRIRRVQWTPRGGYETLEFVGRLTP